MEVFSVNDQLPPSSANATRSWTRVLVIAGLVLGAIWLLATTFFSVLDRAHEKARHANCMSNVKQIGLACAMYADQHNGNLPRSLDDLKPYATSTKVFFCPQVVGTNQSSYESRGFTNNYSYEFVGVTNKWLDNPDLIILREIEPRHNGWRTVLFNDGHVEQKPAKL